jgi:hypothetical protein
MSGIFNKAKSKQTVKKKTNEKLTITPELSSDEMKNFHEKLTKFASLKAEMNKLKSELTSSESFLKNLGTEEFIKQLEKTGKRESSFNLTSETGGRVMVVVMDKYRTIDAERAEYLNETYGIFDKEGDLVEDCGFIEEETTFQFNMTILDRNQEVISELIESCTEISEEDKENLIECITKYSIKKGTIDMLYKISKDKGIDIEVLFEEIQPQVQLKNPKVD